MVDHERIEAVKEALADKRASLAALRKQIDSTSDAYESMKTRHLNAKKARAVLQEVAHETQSALEFHISRIVTLALASVFPDPYILKTNFVVRRERTECDLLFERNGEEIKPTDSSGGGPVDVACFALRVALWNLDKQAPVIVMDEPFRFVSHDLQHKVAEMLNMISEQLGIQIIMVSHLTNLIEGANHVVEIRDGSVVGKSPSARPNRRTPLRRKRPQSG